MSTTENDRERNILKRAESLKGVVAKLEHAEKSWRHTQELLIKLDEERNEARKLVKLLQFELLNEAEGRNPEDAEEEIRRMLGLPIVV